MSFLMWVDRWSVGQKFISVAACCFFECCLAAHGAMVAKVLRRCTKQRREGVGLFCLSERIKSSAVMAVLLWQQGERLACHSGLLLSQRGFDVRWHPQITFTSSGNIRFLSVFGLAPTAGTLTLLTSGFTEHKQRSLSRKKQLLWPELIVCLSIRV